MKARVLKIARNKAEDEVEFELSFLASLTVEQRVALVLERSRLLHDMLEQNGHKPAAGISKRR
jgi:hypothetical protein